LNGI